MKTPATMLFTALILGLSWAVRGHFGHEWGAAWAGATGALAVLVATGRVDWFRRLPSLTALGAIGWGIGGMMSYGIVIGYCRADTFHNSLYGYAMLAVIGGLYGFLGGGFLGLGLETTEDKKPNWFVLLSGMVAGGCLIWGIIIYQLEWFMTPPRSEAWALCAGAAMAFGWYTHREGFHRSLRVAAYSGLGGAVGFSVGNFFQTAGAISGVSYNWWNVMEFTLGFCGGLGMAYAVATTRWPKAAKPSGVANWIGLVFIALLLPWSNYANAFETEKLLNLAKALGIEDAAPFADSQQFLGLSLLVVLAIAGGLAWKIFEKRNDSTLVTLASIFLFGYTAYYVTYGFIVKGFFHRSLSIASSDTMYLPILFAATLIWLLTGRGKIQTDPPQEERTLGLPYAACVATALAAILAITAATQIIHDGNISFHERFPTHEGASH